MKSQVLSPEYANGKAVRYFLEDKNNCAEAVLRSILEVTGKDCPVEILKLASAFGRGMGEAGCVCGALIGAQMALGFLYGRDNLTGSAPSLCKDLSRAMHDRFKKVLGSTCCRILHRNEAFGSKLQTSSCAECSGTGAELAIQLINETDLKINE